MCNHLDLSGKSVFLPEIINDITNKSVMKELMEKIEELVANFNKDAADQIEKGDRKSGV